MARWVLLAIAATAALAAIEATDADFAAVTGFSGRRGLDCTQCHTLPPMGISHVPAEVTLSGLPAAWSPGEEHRLTIQVTGGPAALPSPAPRGGFELETDAGGLLVPPGMEDLLRPVGTTGMTYTPDGTLTRTWNVTWRAPGLETAPFEATFWLAALAANGNHDARLNLSDGGERGDSTATTVLTVPASQAAHEAWRAIPLDPPRLEDTEATAPVDGRLLLRGRHMDANATAVAWQVDDERRRDTGTAWLLDLSDLPVGRHQVQVWSEGAGRASPPVTADVQVLGDHVLVPDRIEAPFPFALPILAYLIARRRP